MRLIRLTNLVDNKVILKSQEFSLVHLENKHYDKKSCFKRKIITNEYNCTQIN